MVDAEERKIKNREDAAHEQEEKDAKSGKLKQKTKEHNNTKGEPAKHESAGKEGKEGKK